MRERFSTFYIFVFQIQIKKRMEFNEAQSKQCSSLCSCPLLIQMHQNFVKKFRVFPNSQADNNNDDQNGASASISEKGREKRCSSSDSDNDEQLIHLSDDEEGAPIQSVFFPDELKQQCPTDNGNGGCEEDTIASSLNYKILDEESRTPVPVYELMSETELNAELAKFGHGPMGKRAAIKLLNQIFEATHPVLSEHTPIPRKIARLFAKRENNENPNIARQKRTKAKIACLVESNSCEMSNANQPEGIQQGQSKKQLRQYFLEWLRKPGKEQLYTEILLLNPQIFDKLYTTFKQDSLDLKFSKESFAELLDNLAITHCSRNNFTENQ